MARKGDSSGDLLADRRFVYGQALASEGDQAAAADLFAQTLEIVPGWAPGWFALGEAREKSGDREGAAAAFQRAAALDGPDVLGATLALASLGAAPVPGSAGAAYVRSLFDEYAPRFDAHLSDALAYRGPALLREAISQAAAPPRRFARALDLGCGTGLMGEAIRDRADWLAGVDLSPAMVAKAQEKAVYDSLRVGDMSDTLQEFAPLDLVLAADVLVYVGDLRPLFAAVRAALQPGGLFAFTVQRAPDGRDVSVGQDRRFAHAPDHVRGCAHDVGFTVALCDAVSTRKDAGNDVPGLIAVLTR